MLCNPLDHLAGRLNWHKRVGVMANAKLTDDEERANDARLGTRG
jgi:hypothetical protein